MRIKVTNPGNLWRWLTIAGKSQWLARGDTVVLDVEDLEEAQAWAARQGLSVTVVEDERVSTKGESN